MAEQSNDGEQWEKPFSYRKSLHEIWHELENVYGPGIQKEDVYDSIMDENTLDTSPK